MKVKYILNHVYGIQEAYILDNELCKYNPQIKKLSFLEHMDLQGYCLILACITPEIYGELKLKVRKYFLSTDIAELPSMFYITAIGRHSYGPLCRNHRFIESIGAFCSFAEGADVVSNHEIQYITTSPIIYMGATEEHFIRFTEHKEAPWYIEGIQPKKEKLKQGRRIHIGNDVWLGRNVLITNYANIGNGVIAGAGTVITRDVPDYAVVMGAPARIVRYRYSPCQIESLNKIAWWDWNDKEIRERYDDFYLPVNEFISKYLEEKREGRE